MGEMAIAYRPPTRAITVSEFQQMWETGILKPDERIELIDGDLVMIPPMNAPHASIVARVTDVLQRLRQRALIWAQLPLVTSERSQPLPDVTLLRLRDDYYRERLPAPADHFAVIEISDTMLRYDRGVKLQMYAKTGIADYWIIDVNGRTIEICREPHDLGYGSRTMHVKGDSVAFAAFPDVVFTVDELLG
jgi:Uma2 family endonuclease